MSQLEIEVGHPVQVVSAKWKGDLQCPKCDSKLEYLYSGNKRTVKDLFQVIKLRQHYYLCTNRECVLHKAFQAPHNIVLPHKEYSRNVYEKVIRLYHEVGNNPRQIYSTLNVFNAVLPSEKTIRRYIEEFILLQSNDVDESLKNKILENGGLIMIVDGQRGKQGEPSLWSFLELLSGDHIHAEYLKTADEKTLGEIFLKIEAKYGVKIHAVISDHQKSIVNAVKNYIPDAKHQFCHFHFLKNLADPLEKMDSHLHKCLESGVNNLYINTATTSKEIQMAPNVYEQIQEFFSPIVEDLKSLIKYPSRSFDTWGSLESYKRLNEYCERIRAELLPTVDISSRIGKILSKATLSLEDLLENTGALYDKLCFLIPWFDNIRYTLGLKVLSKKGMKSEADKWARCVKQYLEESENQVDMQAPISQLTYRASIERVFIQWYRLYNSHKSGLFEFLDDSRIPRTNTEIEREYSQELGFWRGLSGRGNVNHYIHVFGDMWLKNHRHYTPDSIQNVLDTYSIERIRQGKAILRLRRERERRTWRNSKKELSGLDEMKKRIREINEKSRLLST